MIRARRATGSGRVRGGEERMGSFSIWHWLVVLAVVLVLFGGGGKISRLMGDFGKGLKSFKKSMADEESGEADAKAIKGEEATATAEPTVKRDKAANG
jgi:sec-independent protein translocase protein TatA